MVTDITKYKSISTNKTTCSAKYYIPTIQTFHVVIIITRTSYEMDTNPNMLLQ